MSYDKNLFPDPFTKNELPKLEKCPKCHEDAARLKYWPGPMKKQHSVCCRRCGVKTKFRYLTAEQAIKAWNNARW